MSGRRKSISKSKPRAKSKSPKTKSLKAKKPAHPKFLPEKKSAKAADISMARLETQSAQAQKMQAVGQLAGGVAHDFNNLLTAIIGACDLMPSGQFKEIQEIRKHAERGADLVRQLLAFSRRQTLRPVPLDLALSTRNICDLITRLLGAQIELKLDIKEPVWMVSADPTQFEQIVVNLAINARDAMPKGGILALRIKNIAAKNIAKLNHILMPTADYVLFEIEDSGHGIASEALGNIFEPFFSTKPQGSGLGLSTVYGIVKQSGGFIFPESRKGQTIFRVYFPRLKESPKETKNKITPIPKSSEGSSKRPAAKKPFQPDQGTILLVEDDSTIRDFAARALENKGFHVLRAACAEDALEVQQNHAQQHHAQQHHAQQQGKIDVLVSDIVMPGMDGINLAKKLSAQNPALKVILISGYAEDAFRNPSASIAHTRFLPKPFGLKELVEAVRAAIKSP